MKHWALWKWMEHRLTGERGLRLERIVGSVAAIVVLVGMLAKIVAAWPHRVVQDRPVPAQATAPPVVGVNPFGEFAKARLRAHPLPAVVTGTGAAGCGDREAFRQFAASALAHDSTGMQAALDAGTCRRLRPGDRLDLLSLPTSDPVHPGADLVLIRPHSETHEFWTLATWVSLQPLPAGRQPVPEATLRALPHKGRLVMAALACTDRMVLLQTGDYLAAGDTVAFDRAVRQYEENGTCRDFWSGDGVAIVDTATAGLTGLVKVRRPGESAGYWTVSRAVLGEP
jgi:hypothetical protein